MKFLIIILVIAGAAWALTSNFDFSQFKANTEAGVSNSVKNEKTIFGVNNTREQNRKQTQDALNEF